MRRAILDVARKAIETDGVANLSLRAVARDLGYSPAALYEYFPDRIAIVRGLYREGAEGFYAAEVAAIEALPGDATAMERLFALGRGYRQYALEKPDLFRLVHEARSSGFDPSVEDLAFVEKSGALLKETIAQGMAEGVMRQRPIDEVFTIAWSTVHGFVLLELGDMLECGSDAETVAGRSAARAAMFETVLDQLGEAIRAP